MKHIDPRSQNSESYTYRQYTTPTTPNPHQTMGGLHSSYNTSAFASDARKIGANRVGVSLNILIPKNQNFPSILSKPKFKTRYSRHK